MYTFDSRIRYSETDENAVLTVGSLINYFQDCSTFQTGDAGAGMEWLSKQHLAWVLNYWQIDIFRLPRLYEQVRVGTVPYALKGFIGLRNYCMDSAGTVVDPCHGAERLAVANSVWTLMDMEKMYPARVTAEHASRYTLEEKLEMEYLDRKIKLPEDGDLFETDPVTIHHGHLDTNRHVNNGQYVRIAMDALEELKKKRAELFETPAERGEGTVNSSCDRESPAKPSVRIRAEYKRQAHLGDVLLPVVHACAPEHLAVDLRLNGESCCVVELQFL